MTGSLRIHILQVFFPLVVSTAANAQAINGRGVFSINDNWKFLPYGTAYAETVAFDDNNWQSISLPHTWNAKDVFDDNLTYVRSIGWYRKELTLDPSFKNKKINIWFEGANQVTTVYVNGYFVGIHKGGYTGFGFTITRYLNWTTGKNIVAALVNNAHDPFIAPLNFGYASYGGIYRDAWIITTGDAYFKDINNNSAGVYISTPSVSSEQASITIKTTISNESNRSRSFQFVNTLVDAATGISKAAFSKKITVAANSELEVKVNGTVDKPKLWSPQYPNLYAVTSQLIEEDGTVIDEVENKIGFRWFSFDNGNGFSLNGQKLQLRGTNRHQDLKDEGDALTMEDHRRDMQLIKDMGCNFVRLAHYPQTAAVLSLADELGLIIWEEVPVVNFITNHPEFLNNSCNMIREMIHQGYNHPSIIMWGSSNEILLHGPDGERIGRHNDSLYLKVVKKFSRQLDSTVRGEDPTRYSTVAMHISADYGKWGLDTVSQAAGYNIYSGWYSGKAEDFGNDMDRRKRPGHNVFISEYGAEGEARLNTEKPMRMDYTGQYQRYFHESYLRQINQRSWLAGTAIWNEFDFSQPNIGGPAPHMNQKGLVTWDRRTKDAYYIYKANWNPAPMVYIATRDWLIRAGEKDVLSTIDVYSNAAEVNLSVNGVAQKKQRTNDIKKVSWQVLLKDGVNDIVATAKINGKEVSDHVVIQYHIYDAQLSNRKLSTQPLLINIGSNAQYIDPSGFVWIEDRAYQSGSFGYVSGKPAAFDRKDVIKNTDDEPMFYTYSDSLTAYRLDIPEGKYRLSLYFAEPRKLNAGDRIFSVSINGDKVINDLDMTGSYGFAQAFNKTFIVESKKSDGITIRFESKKGSAILNGLKVERMP